MLFLANILCIGNLGKMILIFKLFKINSLLGILFLKFI